MFDGVEKKILLLSFVDDLTSSGLQMTGSVPCKFQLYISGTNLQKLCGLFVSTPVSSHLR